MLVCDGKTMNKAIRMSNLTRMAVGCLLSSLFSGLASSAEPRILRVEEDWELVVITPNPLQNSPQISTWMSPGDSLENQHFGANFNHAQKDDYIGGGFQTRAYQGASVMDDKVSCNGMKLSANGELLKWTQVMAIIQEELVFAIKDGTSQSWGDFGGKETLVRYASTVTDLNGYRPTKSVEWSGVGFAANRVALLKLSKVRYFTDQGQVIESSVNLIVQ